MWATFKGIQIDTKLAAIQNCKHWVLVPKRNGGATLNFLPIGSNPAGLNVQPSL